MITPTDFDVCRGFCLHGKLEFVALRSNITLRFSPSFAGVHILGIRTFGGVMFMPRAPKIALLGGDLRQCYAAEFLSQYFDEVAIWGLGKRDYKIRSIRQYETPQDALAGCTHCILPVKVSRDSETLDCPLSQGAKAKLLCIFDIFSSKSTTLGGIVSNETINELISRGHRYINYFEREELQIKNALLTAEGAIAEGIMETPVSLLGAKVAVLGYGRIAKLLCEKLSLMGAIVTVFARKKSDRADAFCHGATAFSFENDFCRQISEGFDLIYNTVPTLVVNASTVACMNPNTVYIDLATAPGGIDFEAAKQHGIKAVQAWGLPGKVSPKSAGRIVAETIVQILTEEGYIT